MSTQRNVHTYTLSSFPLQNPKVKHIQPTLRISGFFLFFFFYFIFKTLHNCISFAKYQNESATVVSISTDSTKCRSKIFWKKFGKFQIAKLEFATIYTALTLYLQPFTQHLYPISCYKLPRNNLE